MFDFFSSVLRSLAGDAGIFVLFFFLCVLIVCSRLKKHLAKVVLLIGVLFCFFVTAGAANFLSKPLLFFSARHQRLALAAWKDPASTQKLGRKELGNCLRRVNNMVVLGGGMDSDFVPSAATHLRVLRAVRAKPVFLAQQGANEPAELQNLPTTIHTKNIFFSGGPTYLTSRTSEAEIMQFLFQALEHELAKRRPVPARLRGGTLGRDVNMFIEDQSLTTYENALYTRAKFSQLKEKPEIILVTGSLHMLRAMLTFEKQGFKVCALEAPEPRTATRKLFSFAEAKSVSAVFHEYLGILSYRLSGKL